MEYTRTIDVAAGIIWRGGLFLAAQRPTNKIMEGYWEFPGGKLEAGESPEDALKRELAEELGISPLNYTHALDLEHDYPEFKVTLHVFVVDAYSGQIAALDKQTLAWLLPKEAASLPFLAADVPIVEKLLNGSL